MVNNDIEFINQHSVNIYNIIITFGLWKLYDTVTISRSNLKHDLNTKWPTPLKIGSLNNCLHRPMPNPPLRRNNSTANRAQIVQRQDRFRQPGDIVYNIHVIISDMNNGRVIAGLSHQNDRTSIITLQILLHAFRL